MLDILIRFGTGYIYGWIFGKILAVILIIVIVYVGIRYGDPSPSKLEEQSKQAAAWKKTQDEQSGHANGNGWYTLTGNNSWNLRPGTTIKVVDGIAFSSSGELLGRIHPSPNVNETTTEKTISSTVISNPKTTSTNNVLITDLKKQKEIIQKKGDALNASIGEFDILIQSLEQKISYAESIAAAKDRNRLVNASRATNEIRAQLIKWRDSAHTFYSEAEYYNAKLDRDKIDTALIKRFEIHRDDIGTTAKEIEAILSSYDVRIGNMRR